MKRMPRWAVGLGLGVSACAAVALGLLVRATERAPRDPSRRGPARWLELSEASLEAESLRVAGTTNLVDGCLLHVEAVDGRARTRLGSTRVEAGVFALATAIAGLDPTASTLRIEARFELIAQERAVLEALHYQPERLSASRTLGVAPSPVAASAVSRAVSAPEALRDLLCELNAAAGDAEALTRLDVRARELARGVWIGKQELALRRARQAIEEAQRPEFQRETFERLLLEAYVLAGL